MLSRSRLWLDCLPLAAGWFSVRCVGVVLPMSLSMNLPSVRSIAACCRVFDMGHWNSAQLVESGSIEALVFNTGNIQLIEFLRCTHLMGLALGLEVIKNFSWCHALIIRWRRHLIIRYWELAWLSIFHICCRRHREVYSLVLFTFLKHGSDFANSVNCSSYLLPYC